MSTPILEVEGFCPTCDQRVVFRSDDKWFRDHFKCSNCDSIPRQRALMHAIEMYYPQFRKLAVHESSPGPRGASAKLLRECENYVASQYDPSIPFGEVHRIRGYRSEDLENLTFADESFDLVITQDVFEHLFDPERAFAEIARTLKPGGAHIFTTPLVKKLESSVRCAVLEDDGTVRHLQPPKYHGNPVDRNGSLVTIQWGYDICHAIYEASGLLPTILLMDNLELGIRAELIEVIISTKSNQIDAKVQLSQSFD